ncbi:D-alanyl-D-alanine carboxypeptidase [Miltoncostaea marina]|uniref:D-alanyl-D-alanine carboxypeptidase n=1 Tax=Miltoncostaea marina TaxID=2843215 RepID=UPI001C3C9A07|nr:D-alanyl-D-alanine carboxypeptidase [Miltoncostaea marina]
MPRPARLAAPLALVLAAVAAPAAAQTAPAPQPPVAPAPPVAPGPAPAVPAHPAARTGWVVPLAGGEPLRPAPDPAVAATAVAPSARVAGRLQRVARGPDGSVWLRVAFPDAVRGWVDGAAVAAAPPPPALAPAVRRALVRRTASLGGASALVVRDPLGRTLFAAGTRAPLILASVTKVATVAAALADAPMRPAAAAAILRPSDNRRAQALSTALGGGSRGLGARRAVEAAAALGAEMRLVDGSGLSRGNRAAAGEVADLLHGLRDAPRFPVLLRALPVAGRSGTLQWRMRGSWAHGRLRAKTGTLADPPAASALAGYLWPHRAGPSPDRALVVVAIANRVAPWRARPVHDAVARELAAPGALVPARRPGIASATPGR